MISLNCNIDMIPCAPHNSHLNVCDACLIETVAYVISTDVKLMQISKGEFGLFLQKDKELSIYKGFKK